MVIALNFWIGLDFCCVAFGASITRLAHARQQPYPHHWQENSRKWYADRMQRAYHSMLNFGEGQDMFPQLGPVS